MFLADTHTHSSYSFDSSSSVEQMIQGARQRQVDVLCLTEHCDFWPDGRCLHYQKGEQACEKQMLALRGAGQKPQVLYGVELGQPQVNPAEARALLARHDYDMVIGSIHTLSDGRDIYGTRYTGLDVCESVFDRYFSDVEDLLAFGDFDTLGHLDYPMRVMGGLWPAPTLAPYRERLAPLLKELARQGKALEVNPTGGREWFRQPGPERWALELFRQYGGRLVTTGSDAHKPQNCGQDLLAAQALLRAAGFDCIATFERRQPRLHKI